MSKTCLMLIVTLLVTSGFKCSTTREAVISEAERCAGRTIITYGSQENRDAVFKIPHVDKQIISNNLIVEEIGCADVSEPLPSGELQPSRGS